MEQRIRLVEQKLDSLDKNQQAIMNLYDSLDKSMAMVSASTEKMAQGLATLTAAQAKTDVLRDQQHNDTLRVEKSVEAVHVELVEVNRVMLERSNKQFKILRDVEANAMNIKLEQALATQRLNALEDTMETKSKSITSIRNSLVVGLIMAFIAGVVKFFMRGG